jgi:hypothetical protein
MSDDPVYKSIKLEALGARLHVEVTTSGRLQFRMLSDDGETLVVANLTNMQRRLLREVLHVSGED